MSGKQSVQIAYVHPNMVSHSFMMSYLRMFAYDLGHNQRLIPSSLGVRCGALQLVDARNKSVKYFLDNTEAEWLFLIDTDMGFTEDTVDRLIESAETLDQPAVVGGLCFGIEEAQDDGYGGWKIRPFPTIFDWRISEKVTGYVARSNYPKDELTKVDATGAACLLIPRVAAEKIRSEYGDNWFTQLNIPPYSGLVSEDFSLCYRLSELGIPIYVDTKVKTTHHKQIWFSDAYYAP